LPGAREYKTITIHQEVVMGCGCGKKRTGTVHFMGKDAGQMPEPEEWGPILWKYLHCLAEKLGTTGNTLINTDQTNHIEILITSLHQVLPCTECQAHAAAYIASNPFPTVKGLSGDNLRTIVRTWLFNFHNSVRARKGQPIIVNTPEECASVYAGCFIPKCEYTFFVQSVAYAVRQGWVRIDNWKKWYSHSERLRMISGNIVA
jgi:hypothetical protein